MGYPQRIACALILTACAGTASADWWDRLLKQASEIPALPTAEVSAGKLLGEEEIARALKEALNNGARQAVAGLGREGGFLEHPRLRIPMPEQLGQVERALRAVKQERLADDFVASLNHAAERAVPEAAGLFGEAIAGMTLADARSILQGSDDAATRYLRQASEARLLERFRPIVREATDRVGVTRDYKRLMQAVGPYYALLGGKTVDLEAYVAGRAMDGLFSQMAEEERRIRQDPAARTTELLRKVFGSLKR